MSRKNIHTVLFCCYFFFSVFPLIGQHQNSSLFCYSLSNDFFSTNNTVSLKQPITSINRNSIDKLQKSINYKRIESRSSQLVNVPLDGGTSILLILGLLGGLILINKRKVEANRVD